MLARELYTFSISYYRKSKDCLKVVKILLDPLPQFTFENNRISQKILKKEKHVLKQDTLLCWLRQSNIEKKPLSFSPPSQLQTPVSSSGTPDFLSTYLGIDSHMDPNSFIFDINVCLFQKTFVEKAFLHSIVFAPF